jgi:hypothetical protein
MNLHKASKSKLFFGEDIVIEFKKSVTLLYITFSNVLENVSNEIGLWLEMQDFSPFLYRGFTFGYLSSGKVSLVSD